MFNKIEDDKPELEPKESQYIAFKCGSIVFVGVYLGQRKAQPFTTEGTQGPTMLIEEWMPIRLWA